MTLEYSQDFLSLVNDIFLPSGFNLEYQLSNARGKLLRRSKLARLWHSRGSIMQNKAIYTWSRRVAWAKVQVFTRIKSWLLAAEKGSVRHRIRTTLIRTKMHRSTVEVKRQSLSNEELVDFCYQSILRRAPDKEGREYFLDALNGRKIGKEDILMQFLTSEEYRNKAGSQEFVPPGHFYSAVPSLQEREAFVCAYSPNDRTLGLDINEDGQLAILNEFEKYYKECPFPERKTESFRYYFDNPAYSYTDALTLYSMIRKFQPEKIVEIGSGFSSAAMLDTNDTFFDGKIDLNFIEPYPELLKSLLRPNDTKHEILGDRLQDVGLDAFLELKENDILFVDSTHVSKLNSDVNKIIFDVLPSLKRGVVIHFHDIFWPFEYPKQWIEEGRAWNEAYILRAFLEFNSSFEVIFFASYLHQHFRSVFADKMPLYLKNPGGNIWIRKVA